MHLKGTGSFHYVVVFVCAAVCVRVFVCVFQFPESVVCSMAPSPSCWTA